MKFFCFAFVFLTSLSSSAACKVCYSLEDALESPQDVVILNLSAQALTEQPKELSQFINLERLYLNDNFLIELDFSLLQLPQLKELNVSNNPGFNAMALNGIDKALPKLQELRIENCNLVQLSPEIAKIESLYLLEAANNNLKAIPQEVEEMTSLTHLLLANNRIETKGLLFSHLWNVKHLDLSGNENIDLISLASALSFKKLDYLSITPKSAKKILPKEFKQVHAKTLVIHGAQFKSLRGSVATNEHIESVVFDDCIIEDMSATSTWLNSMNDLKDVTFMRMHVPEGSDQLRNMDEVTFQACSFEDKEDVSQIKKPIVYVNNTKLGGAEVPMNGIMDGAPLVKESTLAESMQDNIVPSIKSVSAKRFEVNNAEVTIEMDNSSYYIPEGAFLDADGEVYTGKAIVEVKEYFDPVTNALAGMPMYYEDEEESGVFSSSGMIDFRAYNEQGEELFANPEQPVEVAINDLQPSENAELYYFNESTNQWEEATSEVSFEKVDFGETKQRLIDSLAMIDDEDLVFTRMIPVINRMSYKKKRLTASYLNLNVRRAGFQKMMNTDRSKIYLSNDDQVFLRKFHWRIDTVVTKEMHQFMKRLKKEQRKLDYKIIEINQRRRSYDSRPRLMLDLKITPDVQHDNYTLSFMYKGEVVQIPVYPEIKGSIARVQQKEKRNFKNYERKKRESDKQLRKVKRIRENYVGRQAQKIREEQVAFLQQTGMVGNPPRGRLLLSMVLGFGLINCDFIPVRPEPQYHQLAGEARNQKNEIIPVPDEIRTINRADNSYTIYSGRLIPTTYNSISQCFFEYEEGKIAVVLDAKRAGGNEMKAKVHTFDVKDKSMEEIVHLLNGI